MRYKQAEKMEIIRLVEDSSIGVKKTLAQLGINRSTYYKWYDRYVENGYDGLADNYRTPERFWNTIPPWEKQNIIELALEHPDKSPRELAWYIVDTFGYYVSESTVYRLLKANDLATSPAYIVLKARDKFAQPTVAVNELWQTDFTYFKIVHWGWYYLTSILDDFSRYIIAWKLCKTMGTDDVKSVLDEAIAVTGVKQAHVFARPRLLSDNGSCYVSGALREYLEQEGIRHVRSKPMHPMTQGKIERYHRSLKNVVMLDNYYMPEELAGQIGLFIAHYNNYRYHESLENVTPADVFYGRQRIILDRRNVTKEKTIQIRRQRYDNIVDTLNKQEYISINTKTVS
jgi:putative transposase